MTPSKSDKEQIQTCPLGNGFYLPAAQAWGTLKVFNAYQIVLSSAFFFLFISKKGPSLFGQSDSSLFMYASATYLAIAVLSALLIRKPLLSYSTLVQLSIFAEITLLTLIMHSSGGITSGLGVLLAVTVAAGGLLAGGQCTLAFAALATFLILGEQVYASSINSFATTAYTYAGVLSASFFTIATLAMVLAKRVEVTEELAAQHVKDIYNLEQLNSYIIQHLQSGIIVIDAEYNIRLANDAAGTFLNKPLTWGEPLATSASECWHLFNRWLRAPEKNTAILSSRANLARLQLKFNKLDSLGKPAFIIFLDDLSAVDQQIQQGKLASLGHLTASIAHEIRNPLGAISHAGQLLSESDNIANEDKRLLEIIHNHSDRVNSIVKSILQLSRQEQTLTEPVKLNKWLVDFEKEFSEQFALIETPFNISFSDSNILVNFDKNHLKQIIDNLCSNALKYGQNDNAQETINIDVIHDLNKQQTSISIIDNGPGIEKKTVQHIFEPFYTTSSTGTGLGLYISNQLAELNHASLSYSAPATGGSCFTLTITDKTF
ncbi:MAG: two-component sensor histidine kinase [Piscirickettsiaceae bacterium]|nr:MAG: two-component sensor histidine kinase [Piscirickettsiaceae bacterium]